MSRSILARSDSSRRWQSSFQSLSAREVLPAANTSPLANTLVRTMRLQILLLAMTASMGRFRPVGRALLVSSLVSPGRMANHRVKDVIWLRNLPTVLFGKHNAEVQRDLYMRFPQRMSRCTHVPLLQASSGVRFREASPVIEMSTLGKAQTQMRMVQD